MNCENRDQCSVVVFSLKRRADATYVIGTLSLEVLDATIGRKHGIRAPLECEYGQPYESRSCCMPPISLMTYLLAGPALTSELSDPERRGCLIHRPPLRHRISARRHTSYPSGDGLLSYKNSDRLPFTFSIPAGRILLQH